MTSPEHDIFFMQAAMKEAQKAALKREVPVGALWVFEGKIAARGHNLRETKQSPLSHAEIEVLTKAARKKKNFRLGGTLYVTLEPCPMCMGAIIQARIDRLVFGCGDPKAGACGGVFDLNQFPFNHRVQVASGVLETPCRELLQKFFKKLR